MNINENIRNKRKMLENLKGCTYSITHLSAADYSRLQKLVPNVNINENIKQRKKNCRK